MQSPAGFLVDRLPYRRHLLAGASLLLGFCYGILPLVPARWWSVDPLLFIAGMGQAFFTPLLGALALGLVGHARLSKTMGCNQGWNHAGNIAAAVSAMALVTWIGLSSVFFAVAVVAVLAAASVFIIRPNELNERRASGATDDGANQPVGYWRLLRDRRIVILSASTALFHSRYFTSRLYFRSTRANPMRTIPKSIKTAPQPIVTSPTVFWFSARCQRSNTGFGIGGFGRSGKGGYPRQSRTAQHRPTALPGNS